jgi:magnesium chelatase family protein
VQSKRFRSANTNGGARKINTNSEMNVKELAIYAPLTPEIKKLLNDSAERLQLSARAYHRTIKLARTIADLDGSNDITSTHILEALQYRPRTNN